MLGELDFYGYGGTLAAMGRDVVGYDCGGVVARLGDAG